MRSTRGMLERVGQRPFGRPWVQAFVLDGVIFVTSFANPRTHRGCHAGPPELIGLARAESLWQTSSHAPLSPLSGFLFDFFR